MVLAISEVRGIVDRVCARQDVLDACAKRDLGAIIAMLNAHGLTQGQLATLTCIPQGRLSEYKTRKRVPTRYTIFEKFADGLGMPSAARQALGLAASEAAVIGIGSLRSRLDVSPEYPGTPAQAAQNVSSLWRADLADTSALNHGRIDPAAWNGASLRWLTDPVSGPDTDLLGGVRVGMGDVERFRTTVELFKQLDD